jgi:transposase
MVRAATTEQRLTQRARMVLAAGRGRALAAIARDEGVAPDTVARWRHRFAEHGIAGPLDRPRSGRRPVYDHDDRVAIVAKVCEPPPGGPRTGRCWRCMRH